jgi:hypothetical protein
MSTTGRVPKRRHEAANQPEKHLNPNPKLLWRLTMTNSTQLTWRRGQWRPGQGGGTLKVTVAEGERLRGKVLYIPWRLSFMTNLLSEEIACSTGLSWSAHFIAHITTWTENLHSPPGSLQLGLTS